MSEKSTYQEVVHSFSKRAGRSRQDADRFVHALSNAIESALVTDGQTHLASFGKWERRHYKARPGRHPQTGEQIQIPAHDRAVFKPYKFLKETVNSDFLHLDARPISSKSDLKAAVGTGQSPPTPDKQRTSSTREEPLLQVRERPSHAGPPPFFIELDEHVTDSDTDRDLVRVLPSPVTDQQGDTEKG